MHITLYYARISLFKFLFLYVLTSMQQPSKGHWGCKVHKSEGTDCQLRQNKAVFDYPRCSSKCSIPFLSPTPIPFVMAIQGTTHTYSENCSIRVKQTMLQYLMCLSQQKSGILNWAPFSLQISWWREREKSGSKALIPLLQRRHEIRTKYKLRAVLHYRRAPLAFLSLLLRQTDLSLPPSHKALTMMRMLHPRSPRYPELPYRHGGTDAAGPGSELAPSRGSRAEPQPSPREAERSRSPARGIAAGSPSPGAGRWRRLPGHGGDTRVCGSPRCRSPAPPTATAPAAPPCRRGSPSTWLPVR